ncbi:hypothetical protein CH333_01780 [candidate division WOR-3 bacterium JGI_Cruoil_03_44_89]|uniref:DUF3800 domain-containing protein n=1 Tax=candidate division WOR-3 bacterium JGI_Cruoil_03_44_89 TaxID=1973748 RepID=A0A235BYF2_UNCW3|nr:MAG: hypothetical protein CH333_01780 [candidate division WOR-3 bacterium JGI_Cruoil_03_44_89]
MRKRFRIYIDESGDHTYKQLKHPANRYLGLIGCVFEFEKIEIFKRNLEEFKQKFLTYDPDLPPILHRNDIINRRGCFGRLCDTEVEKKFNNDLLDLLKETNFKIIAVVIDKKNHIEKYKEAAFHPYHFCLAAILERYCGFLNFTGGIGDVLGESRGGKEDKQLKEAYKRVYSKGTLWREPNFFQSALSSKEIKSKPKRSNIAGLQLADILAYPVKQEILLDNKRISDPGDVFGKKICRVIKTKYNKHLYRGYIKGYGKIFI